MTVRRIVADLNTKALPELRAFYVELLELDVAMDMGWVVTLAGSHQAPVQLTLVDEAAAHGPTPALSIEVDDVDATFARARAMALPIEQELTDEPWGVRRFFVRDPEGRLLNILSHRS